MSLPLLPAYSLPVSSEPVPPLSSLSIVAIDGFDDITFDDTPEGVSDDLNDFNYWLHDRNDYLGSV